jgi:hypothetical protein
MHPRRYSGLWVATVTPSYFDTNAKTERVNGVIGDVLRSIVSLAAG